MTLLSRVRIEAIYLAALAAGVDYLNVGIANGKGTGLREVQREAYRTLYSEVTRRLTCSGTDNVRVLEIGCGLSAAHRDGLWPATLPHEAIDISRIAVGVSRRRGVTVRMEDVRNLGAPTGHYDAVIGLECLCAMPVPIRKEALREIARVLSPSGRLITLDFFRTPPRNLARHIGKYFDETPLEAEDFTDLSDPARAAVVETHDERSAIFSAIPGPVRRSGFGVGLMETLSLEGSNRFADWVEHRRAYALTVAKRAA